MHNITNTLTSVWSLLTGAEDRMDVEEEEETPPPPIGWLPIESIIHIFSYLTPKDLGRCQMVCRLWRACGETNSLWESFFQRENFPPPSPQAMDVDAKARYMSFLPCKIKKRKYKKTEHSFPKLTAFFQKHGRNERTGESDIPLSGEIWHKSAVAFPCNEFIQLWNAKTGECELDVNEKYECFDYDDQFLVSVHKKDEQFEIKEWDRRSGDCTTAYPLELTEPEHCVLRPGEICLADFKTLSIVDRENHKIVAQYEAPQSIECLSQETSLLLAAGERTIFAWDSRTPQSVMSFPFHQKGESQADVSSTLLLRNETLISDDWHMIKFWDIRNGQRVYSFANRLGPVCMDVQGDVLAKAWSYSNPSEWSSLYRPTLRSLVFMDIGTKSDILTLPSGYAYLRSIHWIGSSLYGLTDEGTLLSWHP